MTNFDGKKEAEKIISQAGIEACSQGIKLINDAIEGLIDGMAAAGKHIEEKRKKEGWW